MTWSENISWSKNDGLEGASLYERFQVFRDLDVEVHSCKYLLLLKLEDVRACAGQQEEYVDRHLRGVESLILVEMR